MLRGCSSKVARRRAPVAHRLAMAASRRGRAVHRRDMAANLAPMAHRRARRHPDSNTKPQSADILRADHGARGPAGPLA